MKKFLSLAFILMLAASTAMAAEKGKASTKKSSAPSSMGVETASWSVQFQGDLSFIVTDTSDSVTYTGIGFGVEASAVYAFNKNFSLGLLSGLHAFDVKDPSSIGPYSGVSWSYTPLELVAQYTFSGEGIRPYVLFGAGVAINSLSIDMDGIDINQGYSEVDPIVSPGIGVAFDLSDKASFFIQTRLDMTFQTQDWKDLLSASGNLGDGMFLPIQLGVNFSAL